MHTSSTHAHTSIHVSAHLRTSCTHARKASQAIRYDVLSLVAWAEILFDQGALLSILIVILAACERQWQRKLYEIQLDDTLLFVEIVQSYLALLDVLDNFGMYVSAMEVLLYAFLDKELILPGVLLQVVTSFSIVNQKDIDWDGTRARKNKIDMLSEKCEEKQCKVGICEYGKKKIQYEKINPSFGLRKLDFVMYFVRILVLFFR